MMNDPQVGEVWRSPNGKNVVRVVFRDGETAVMKQGDRLALMQLVELDGWEQFTPAALNNPGQITTLENGRVRIGNRQLLSQDMAPKRALLMAAFLVDAAGMTADDLTVALNMIEAAKAL